MRKVLIGLALFLPLCAVAAEFVPDESKIRDSMAETLRDPDSAKLKSVEGGMFFNGTRNLPYVCGLVNAKNAYGAYSGYQPFIVILDSESLTSAKYTLLDIGGISEGMCKKVRASRPK